MKKLFFIVAAMTACIYSRAQDAPKIAPYAAVDWQGDSPLVKVDEQWFYLDGIDSINTSAIVSFAKNKFSDKWKKRFSEDIVEVLLAMGHHPDTDVKLVLSKDSVTRIVRSRMTRENRQRIKDYNKSTARTESAEEGYQQLSALQLREDLGFLKTLITNEYSYAEVRGINYDSIFHELSAKVPDSMLTGDFPIEIQKLVSLFGDGHSGVSGISRLLPGGFLPFIVKPYQNRVLCIDVSGRKLVNNDYPFLKSVNKLSVDSLLAISRRIVPSGSKQFVTGRSVERLMHIEYILREAGAWKETELDIVLTNEQGSELVQTTEILRKKPASTHDDRTNPSILKSDIGYLRLSSMSSSEQVLQKLRSDMKAYIDTKGLIIDIRDNPGGSRDILNLLYPYFLPVNSKPIVVSAAAFRVDKKLQDSKGHLADRYMYPLSSGKYDQQEVKAIREFSKRFHPEWDIPSNKFSDWHYLVLTAQEADFHYRGKVVVLVNANSFSAADVFAAAFKEIPGVILLGQPTGGGSGRAKEYALLNSGIKIKLSSMASFQANGLLFDYHGVEPDIAVDQRISDILGETDSWLERAIAEVSN